MKKKSFLIISSVALLMIILLIGIKLYSARENDNLKWYGQTKSRDWVALIYFNKAQKSYSGCAYWLKDDGNIPNIKHLGYKYYEDGKLKKSENNNQLSGSMLSFIDFANQPSTNGRVVLKITYEQNGEKVEKTIILHQTLKKYNQYRGD